MTKDTTGSKSMERRLFLVLLVVMTGLFLYLMKPFFGAIFWACALAILFQPLHRRVLKLVRNRPTIASLVTLFVAAIICVIPLMIIAGSFYQEGLALHDAVQTGRIDLKAYVTAINEKVPVVKEFLDRLNIDSGRINEYASELAMSVGKYIAGNAAHVAGLTLEFFLSLGLMLYLAFFMLRDGPRLVELLVKALPLGDSRERLLITKFVEVTRATVKGTLVVAVLQGSLGGLIFLILGIPGPVLWGVVMTLMSLIPVVGSSIVWGPVAVYLLVTPEWYKGLILIAYGILIIGPTDNILRPILVGRDTKMPEYLVLLSTLGGIAVFGLNGFIIGPLVAALFLAFWDIFATDFSHNPD